MEEKQYKKCWKCNGTGKRIIKNKKTIAICLVCLGKKVTEIKREEN